jgi:divalent metal cation (Fe/Co/Zn/Cd) transporter
MGADCDANATSLHRTLHDGRRLEYFTLGWCLAEAVGGLAAGLLAGSIALVCFGADSLIEMASGAILLWRLGDSERGKSREQVAQRLVGACLLLLAAYVAGDAVFGLVHRQTPEASYFGICFSLLCLVVMPLLARAKRRVAARLDSGAMEADSRQSDFCAYLAAILLVGLLVNAIFGWGWADPAAALMMVPIIAKEGVDALRGRACSCH